MGKARMPADVGPNWWRDIPGYGGKYRASRAGTSRGFSRAGLSGT